MSTKDLLAYCKQIVLFLFLVVGMQVFANERVNQNTSEQVAYVTEKAIKNLSKKGFAFVTVSSLIERKEQLIPEITYKNTSDHVHNDSKSK